MRVVGHCLFVSASNKFASEKAELLAVARGYSQGVNWTDNWLHQNEEHLRLLHCLVYWRWKSLNVVGSYTCAKVQYDVSFPSYLSECGVVLIRRNSFIVTYSIKCNQTDVKLFTMTQQPPVGHGLLIVEDSWSHSDTHTWQDSSGRVIRSSQRPLPDNTQHSQQTNIHAAGGIWTRNPSKRAAADPRLGPHGHWDRRGKIQSLRNLRVFLKIQVLLVTPFHWVRSYCRFQGSC